MKEKLKVRLRQILKTLGKNKNMINNLINYLFKFERFKEEVTENYKFISIVEAIER